jgi:hypothetical protein
MYYDQLLRSYGKYFAGADFFRANYSSPMVQNSGDLAGLTALMPRSGFRLTGLEAASKLFFSTSQTSVRVLSLSERCAFGISQNGSN